MSATGREHTPELTAGGAAEPMETIVPNDVDTSWFGWLVEHASVVRDIGSIALASLGLAFLAWRAISAYRQAEAAQAQAATAQEQVVLARQDSLVDRYQKGSDMLGSQIMSTRLGGIYSLRRLAEDHPEEFHLQVMELLCAFVRNPPPADRAEKALREDVQTALDFVRDRPRANMALEDEADFRINLRNSDLEWADLAGAKFQGAALDNARLDHARGNNADLTKASMVACSLHRVIFSGATFDDANILGANMSSALIQHASFVNTTLGINISDAHLQHADFSNADFGVADLSEARLERANLSGAKFGTGRRGGETVFSTVTQEQLDTAIANPNDPPTIAEGTMDPRTGAPITWNEELCGRRWREYQVT